MRRTCNGQGSERIARQIHVSQIIYVTTNNNSILYFHHRSDRHVYHWTKLTRVSMIDSDTDPNQQGDYKLHRTVFYSHCQLVGLYLY